MEKAQFELEQLRDQRAHQMQLVESIVRQRDMYRVLLAQATGVSFPQQGDRSMTQTGAFIIQSIQNSLCVNVMIGTLGATAEEFSLTSTPRRSPAATPTVATPTGLVSTAIESTEMVEAKAALKQVRVASSRVVVCRHSRQYLHSADIVTKQLYRNPLLHGKEKYP